MIGPGKVFIGLPVYNGSDYIEGVLESLRRQTYTNWQMLISDNASTDSTPIICKKYARKDKRIIYFRRKINIGVIRNYEYVLKQSKGDYFMWASDDDLWESGFIANCIKTIQREKVDFAFSNVDNIDSYGHKIRDYPGFGRFGGRPNVWKMCMFLLEPEIMGKCLPMYSVFRTSVCKRAWRTNPINSKLTLFADNTFVLSLMARFKFGYVDRVLFHKRIVRSDDNRSQPNLIRIVYPFRHMIKKEEYNNYLKLIKKALKNTRYYYLGIFLTILRYPLVWVNDFLACRGR